ncbi:hypothetical protein [Flavobacterium sp.]|uniref:hypothetical protein n=1 Tax=Flavobacterium sp. TaxID=239 RepID=UPI002FD93560
MRKILIILFCIFIFIFFGGLRACKDEDLNKFSSFLFGKSRKPLVNMRLEIKDPSKPHTFRFFVDPNRYPQAYTSLIHGELDGFAELNRYDGCEYYPKENCNPRLGHLVTSKKLLKRTIHIEDVSEYYGGNIILKYTPHTATKGYLYINIKIP